MHKILIIEDDQIMGEMLAMYLSEEGFDVHVVGTGRKGIEMAKELLPEVILLDMMLPDISGTEICQEIRSFSTVPILVVSMKTDITDRVNALMAGADDYICKPFSMRELTAKVEAMIRRISLYQNSILDQEEAEAIVSSNCDMIMLDVEKRSVYVKGFFVETTFSEFEIMKLFINNEEKVFSREELLNELRGFDSFVTERAIDVHIANLRKKIEINPKEPVHIRTVWGVGYKFVSNG